MKKGIPYLSLLPPAKAVVAGGRGGFFSVAIMFSLSLGVFQGCATPMAVKVGYDFSRIRRLSVAPFEGQGGAAISNEFIRQLLGSGYDVSERKARPPHDPAGRPPSRVEDGVDAMISGIVTEYKPSQKLMVFLGNSNTVTPAGQTVVVSNPVVSLSGSQATPEGPAFGLQNTQIVSVTATVDVIARLVDVPSRSVVWAEEFSYEGLDVQGAMQATVDSLVRSLRRVLPKKR